MLNAKVMRIILKYFRFYNLDEKKCFSKYKNKCTIDIYGIFIDVRSRNGKVIF